MANQRNNEETNNVPWKLIGQIFLVMVAIVLVFVFGWQVKSISIFGFGLEPPATSTPEVISTAIPPTQQSIELDTRVNEIVTVNANVRWADSGILIQKGDLVKISYASGKWGPLGGVLHEGWNCDSPYYSDGLMPTAPGSSLIAKIENNAPFCVGASPTFTSEYSGILYFSYNDCVSMGCYGDNTGSLDLKVVVESK